ncbi:MAG: RNase adapter RapZ [Gammaproteobacteria bacterium]
MRLILISGVSGGGKGVVLRAFEDLSYHCVDNPPLTLLPGLSQELAARGIERAAVVIDARNAISDFGSVAQVLMALREADVTCEVVFLEAEDAILLKRFSETRRRHPLTSPAISLAEALGLERRALEPLREAADLVIDSSLTNQHELRERIYERYARGPQRALSLMFQSFGFKRGVPPDADMVFDVRCLPNPYWRAGLRVQTGRDADVIAYLERQPAVTSMIGSIAAFLEQWVPAFEADNRAYLTVAVGCTGGHHRSVYVVERLGEHFGSDREGVIIRHREIG